ncbi:MAG: LptF/LptG family permease [Bacteroidota bacterium]
MNKIVEFFKLGIIDKYIMRKYLSTFFFCVLLFTLIAIFIDISEKMDDYIKRKPPLSVLVFDYYIWFIPYFMGLFSPVFLFLSTIFFNSKQAQNTEIIAVLNSGAPYYRFLKPYILSSALLFVVFLLANMHLMPIADKHRLKFEDDWIHEKVVTQNNNIYYMINDSSVIHMESYNYLDSVGYNCTIEGYSKNKIYNRIFATRLLWNKTKQLWTLENVQQRLFIGNDEPLRKLASLDTILKIKPDEFVLKANYVSSMTNPELNEYIRKEKSKGAPVHKFMVELYKRVAVPTSFFILTILAVAVSSKKSRGGTGAHIALGFALTITYLFLIQIFNVMGFTAVLPPTLAVWIPPAFFLIVALFLLKTAPK